MIDYRRYKHVVSKRLPFEPFWGDGIPEAPLVMLAWSPLPGERKAFSADGHAFVRQCVQATGISPVFVGYHYLIKHANVVSERDCRHWADVTLIELTQYLKPKAIVCCGFRVLDAISRGRIQSDALTMKARIKLSHIPGATVFCIPDPVDILTAHEDGDSELELSVRTDLKAIIDGRDVHFPRLLTI